MSTASTHVSDRFLAARAVADAVLYEGYVLYPYRASAPKNQLRWQFGVLAPRRYAEATASERASCRTECIVDPGAEPQLNVRVRCLQVQRRTIEIGLPGVGFAEVDELEVDGQRFLPWEEAVEHDLDLPALALLPCDGAAREVRMQLAGSDTVEELRSASGELAGQIRRHTQPLDATLRVTVEWADGLGILLKVGIIVTNDTDWSVPDAPREVVMSRSLVAVHTLLAIDDGTFVSLLDPPDSAREAVAGCCNDGTYPVLIGDDDTVMLSSPIILYDHPEIAPESDGPLYDATEIDEILALRVLTLTEDEKAEARATDPRAAAIIDRIDGMEPEVWARMHGTMRELRHVPKPLETIADELPLPWWEPSVDAEVDPWTDTVVISGVEVRTGTSVRLRPSRRADAHDMFFDGMVATVGGVFHDVDGELHVAVTVDDDPATEALLAHGRYLFFHPDEVEPIIPATTRVLVAGIGNIFLSDDGFGVEVARRLRTHDVPEGVHVEDFGIRGLHLAYELLNGYDALVLVDAVPMGEPPGTVMALEPEHNAADRRGTESGHDVLPTIEAHSMSPTVVLDVLEGLGGRVDRIVIVGCEPARIDEGIGLSEPVQTAVDRAVDAIDALLAELCSPAYPKERETNS
jgi:hydrogenase maturation protease